MDINTKTLIRKILLFISGMLTFQIVATIIQFILIMANVVPYTDGTIVCYPNDTICIESFVNPDQVTYDFSNYSSMLMFVSYFVGLLVSFALLWKKLFYDVFESFKIKENIKQGIIFGIIIIIVPSIYSFFIQNLLGSSGNNNQEGVNQIINHNPFLSFMTVVIFAPILEELTYRFALFSTTKKFNKILAYAITILVFALIHFDFTANGYDMLVELAHLPSYLLAAGLLCYAYDRNGFACSTIAHSFNNLISFLLTLLTQNLN